jgi:hypothetical protein
MSKHERQHNTSRVINRRLSDEKRARIDNMSTENEKIKTGFSTCFLTDKILMPDDKKSLE